MEPHSEETFAECPFRIEYPNTSRNERFKGACTSGSGASADSRHELRVEPSPFMLMGEHENSAREANQLFLVQPAPKWLMMNKYKNFVLRNVKYLQGTFVSVANSTTVRRPPNVSSKTLRNRILDGDWLAYILEIRASDEHHVYARVCWLYQPEDLPRHQHRGQRCPAGRQPYHGAEEVIASNHSESRGAIGRNELTELPVDIINVISVTGAASVRRWDEENDNEVQQGLYWRQIIDIRQRKLSPAQPRCSCMHPENPDKMLLRCPNDTCNTWLHEECLAHAAKVRTWERLGNNEPQSPCAESNRTGDDKPKEPKDLEGSGVQKPTQPDIRAEAEKERNAQKGIAGLNNTAFDSGRVLRSHAARPSIPTSTKRKRSPRADPLVSNAYKPYLGLFKAVIRNSLPTPMAEIQDLRPGVVGGEKSWLEPLRCLVCDSAME